MESHSCDGDNKAYDLGFSPDYSKPFILSMTIMTRSECWYCSGAIFSDRDDPNRVQILWHSDKKLDMRVSNLATAGAVKHFHTEPLIKNKKYDVAITYDGSKCNLLLNGESLLKVDCSNAFKSMRPLPMVCHAGTDWGNGWNGIIENLRFQGSKLEGNFN